MPERCKALTVSTARAAFVERRLVVDADEKIRHGGVGLVSPSHRDCSVQVLQTGHRGPLEDDRTEPRLLFHVVWCTTALDDFDLDVLPNRMAHRDGAMKPAAVVEAVVHVAKKVRHRDWGTPRFELNLERAEFRVNHNTRCLRGKADSREERQQSDDCRKDAHLAAVYTGRTRSASRSMLRRIGWREGGAAGPPSPRSHAAPAINNMPMRLGLLLAPVLAATLFARQPATVRNPLADDAGAAFPDGFGEPRHSSQDPESERRRAIAAGARIFVQACQTCHGPAGQGERAPALNTGTFRHGDQDPDLFRTIRQGVLSTQMPPFREFTDEQIWQLVAYIRSLTPRTPMTPAGGVSRAAGDSKPQAVVATLGDGQEIRGIRLNEDTFSVQIMDASGRFHFLDKLTLANLRADTTSIPTGNAADPSASGVTLARLVNAHAEPHNWLMYWGDYQGTHYSALTQIDTTNVHRLRPAWAFPMPGDSVLEATPLVVDGVMYTTQPGVAVALDARTGRQIWKYSRAQKARNPQEINPFNRGAAILGQRLFVVTLDAALVALDARTGLPLWETQVADTMLGYSLTSAPLIVKDKVLVGITGGEFGARGFLDAYDIATGTRIWRWYAVPGPGEFGHDTWAGDSWKQGGSPMWLTGSYDPELNLVYWTVGNPGPQIDRSVRGDLDNLFSDSVVAIDADTGQRKWHYQFTPNDGHDWDSCQDVILVDRMWRGQRRKLLLHADRNGIFYVLDRTNGRFLSGTPFVYVNWTSGFDSNGRPLIVPGSNSSKEGSFFVYPTLGGATNFQAPSYSPLTGWFYLQYGEGGQRYVSSPEPFEAGKHYIGRGTAAGPAMGPKPGEPDRSAGIKALDPDTGKTMWDFKIFQGSLTNGVLATGGNVLFGTIRDGNIVALDARTGKHLWHFQTGANMNASPMSYAIDGRQFIAISAGNTVYAFALPE